MRRYAMAVAVLLIALLVQRGGANGQGREFEAFMTGDQEVPPVATEMLGSVGIRFNDDFTAAKFTLTVKDGVRVTQAHIHCGAQGTNGPIVVFFAGPHAPAGTSTANGSTTRSSRTRTSSTPPGGRRWRRWRSPWRPGTPTPTSTRWPIRAGKSEDRSRRSDGPETRSGSRQLISGRH